MFSFAASIAFAFLPGRVGRRPLLLWSLALMWIVFAVITACSGVFVETGSKPASYVAVAFIYLYNAAHNLGWTGAMMLYGEPNFYPSDLKNLGKVMLIELWWQSSRSCRIRCVLKVCPCSGLSLEPRVLSTPTSTPSGWTRLIGNTTSSTWDGSSLSLWWCISYSSRYVFFFLCPATIVRSWADLFETDKRTKSRTNRGTFRRQRCYRCGYKCHYKEDTGRGCQGWRGRSQPGRACRTLPWGVCLRYGLVILLLYGLFYELWMRWNCLPSLVER